MNKTKTFFVKNMEQRLVAVTRNQMHIVYFIGSSLEEDLSSSFSMFG